MTPTITIVGGGLGGLVLGILLRRREIPVTLFEAGNYPRHRVCGEFVSGRGLKILRDLGALDGLPCLEIQTVQFFLENRSTPVLRLPEPAVAVSRWNLDQSLAERFESLGGDLRPGSRWSGDFETPGVVRATGRRPASGQGRFTGLKVHASSAALGAGLELHFSRAGYAGLAQLPNGEANLCGLFKSQTCLAGARSDPARAFHQILARALPGEIRPESFCAVAGMETSTGRWEHSREFRIGDAMAVIPPLTGNGMSLAVESAHVATPFLVEYARGRADWHKTLGRFSRNCKGTFQPRLRFSSFLQKLAFHPAGGAVFLSCLRTVPRILAALFRLTR